MLSGFAVLGAEKQQGSTAFIRFMAGASDEKFLVSWMGAVLRPPGVHMRNHADVALFFCVPDLFKRLPF